MKPPSDTAVRGVILAAGLAAVVYLIMAAAVELAARADTLAATADRADLAAYHISGMLQEARDITAAAALDRGQM